MVIGHSSGPFCILCLMYSELSSKQITQWTIYSCAADEKNPVCDPFLSVQSRRARCTVHVRVCRSLLLKINKIYLCLSVQLLGSGLSQCTAHVMCTSAHRTPVSGLETISCLHIKFILQSGRLRADKPQKISLQQHWDNHGYYTKPWRRMKQMLYRAERIISCRCREMQV